MTHHEQALAEPSVPLVARGATVAALWREATSDERPFPAYLVEREGGWEEVSWAEAERRVDELANGLLALGVRKGDAFAIMASTSLEWALFDFALALVGAVGAAVYANSSVRDAAYVIDHSDAIGVLVEDEAQRAKIVESRPQLPRLRHVLSFAELDGLAARGREFAREHPAALEDAVAAVGEDDLFTYIYTSGTTGSPKGCMITHRNYFTMAEASAGIEGFTVREDVMLLFLPLAHNFGRLMHLLGPRRGFTIAFLADPLRVAEALAAVRPTVFPSVPRVYEKIHAAVVARLDEATGVRRRLVDWALGVGRRVSELRRRGAPIPPTLAFRHRLADRLVFAKVKARVGGRLRVAISGGAPLAAEIAEFFHALDILVLEGYGLTECTTAATVNRPTSFRFGTVGPPLPGVEVRLAEDGELLIRSPSVFAGYYKDEAATRAVLTDDGWLRSGDLATIDPDGFVTITDRKKDILVTAGGKNVAPQNLENDLKGSRYVSQALVVGDRRPYVAALVTLDEEEIARWARARGLGEDVATLADHPDVVALVQEATAAANGERSRYEQIKRFRILPRDFSADHGEITPTLKLKRRICQEHFAAEIEALYPA
ncbi:MAG: long-chain fatty acid--CoA ligase [Gaiellaceae bacterium]